MFKFHSIEKLTPELEAGLLTKLRKLSFTGTAAAKIIEIITLSNMWSAIRYLRSLNRGVADDKVLVSIAYRAMHRALKYAKPGRVGFFSYAKPYLRGELANELKDLNFNYRRVEMRTEEAFDPEEADDMTDAEREETKLGLVVDFDFPGMFASEALGPMREAIQRVLSERERIIILMRFEGGRNFQQIADLLKITRSSTQATFRRGLRKLRTALKKTEELRNENPGS